MGGYVVILCVAALATYLMTFSVRRFALRSGLVVAPDERRVHERSTPTMGGIAMYGAFLISMLVAYFIPQFRTIFSHSTDPEGVICAVTIMFVGHIIDDKYEISAPAKIATMVVAGSVMSHLGVSILYFKVPFGSTWIISPDIAPLVTVAWLILIANAINLIDGLDGLASGVVCIAAASYFFYGDRLFKAGILSPDNAGPLVAIIACGVCIGFLPHNFHPARIFMGDSGAMLLGTLLASSAMLIGGRTDVEFAGRTYFFFAPIVIPFVVLGVPFLDMTWAVLRRAKSRSGIATADKAHLHHRLMRLGHGQRRSVFILWTWTAILSGIVLLPMYLHGRFMSTFVYLAIPVLAVILFTSFHPISRHQTDGHQTDGRAIDQKVKADEEI